MLGSVLGSVAVRPAVPARRLPFLPVVLCKRLPLSPVGVPVSVAAFGRLSFGVGVRLGSARCVAVGSVVLVLVSVCPSPPFSRFFSSSFLLPPLNPLLFYYYYIS